MSDADSRPKQLDHCRYQHAHDRVGADKQHVRQLVAGPQSNPAPGTQTSTGPTQAPSIPDDANVVRGGSGSAGGANSPEGIAAGTGMHPSGVTGFSAESAPGKSVEELSKGVPNAHIGCCKAGEVRAAGGDVVPTSGRSPNHVTVTGVSPAQGSQLLTPTIPNPSKVKPKVKPKDKPE